MFYTVARLVLVLGVVGIAGGLGAACGKKGPPLAPIVRIPAAVDTLRAERVGNDVYLSLTVPRTNVDMTLPPDIERIDIYGYTGATPPPRNRIAEAGTLVAQVRIGVPPAPVDAALMATPGATITVIDALEASDLEQGIVLPPTPEEARRLAVQAAQAAQAPPAAAAATAALHRYYAAVPFSPRGRPGPQMNPVDLPLYPLPQPPEAFAVSVAVTGATLTWEPGGGLLGFMLDAPLPPEPPPGVEEPTTAAPVGPTRYNVYRLTPAPPAPPVDPAVPPLPAAPFRQAKPRPLNPVPLTELRLVDQVTAGAEHCYVVRAVRGDGPTALEGEASPRYCFTPRDEFPPAAPAGLVAVAAEGSVSLIWEPSSDVDLAGYVVLRGAPGDATLQRLTPAPITEARFEDKTATAGTRYVYAVQAVDTAGNVSTNSNLVEETAR